MDSTLEFTLVKAVYQNSKNIVLSEVSMKTTGYLFEASEVLSLNIENVEIDYSQVTRGFYLLSSCNYPDASLTTSITFTNLTVSESQTRTSNIQSSFLDFAGPANVTITDSQLSMYATKTEPFSPIQYTTLSSCNPNDGLMQMLSIRNTKFILNQNSDNSRYSQVSVSIASTHARNINIEMSGNTFQGFVDNYRPIYEVYGNSKTTMTVHNMTLNSASFIQTAMYFSDMKTLNLNAVSLSGISKFDRALIQMNSGKFHQENVYIFV